VTYAGVPPSASVLFSVDIKNSSFTGDIAVP
jgi:hypothetical protein